MAPRSRSTPAMESARKEDQYLETSSGSAPAMEDLFGKVIFAYTRAQAIADGVLVGVDEKVSA